MKNLLLLTSVFLGSSLLATNVHKSTRPKSYKIFRSGAAGPVGNVYVVIDKSNYELNLYDDKGWYATYPVVFGNNSLSDKKMQGDRNTPEGTFRIIGKRVHNKWYRFMHIDYPNKESYEKFNRRKQRGEIPVNAQIGGAIGIHGTWPHEDFVVDRYKNWTEGCISMKRDDVDEIYRYCPVGTRVVIRK